MIFFQPGETHNMSKTIFVVGGAGFIGSHVNKQLDAAGYKTIVLDNLSTGSQEAVTRGTFIKGDLADSSLLSEIFSCYPVDAVMHFAAFADVGESVLDPLKYYTNNVGNTLHLLNAMHKYRIKTLIFSSTASIFGLPEEDKITENHPKKPINPYGQSKLMVEQIINDAEKAYGMRSCALRYFNAAGGDPELEIKNFKKKENNLIPIILRNLRNGKHSAAIFGADYPTPDGTCIRDYIHILDLGKAHIRAMEQLFEGKPSCSYNLGNGRGFSVKEVIQTIEKVTGISIETTVEDRRPGDPPILMADSRKALQELGWHPQYPDIETMISHAWNALPSDEPQ